MGALRAFRKPEVTVTSVVDLGAATGVPAATSARLQVQIHRPEDREPLPLAFHHTPLTVTFGVLVDTTPPLKENALRRASKTILVADCSRSEELTLDGSLSVSVNGHEELVALNKPGHISLAPAVILQAVQQAVKRAKILHAALDAKLIELQKHTEAQQSMRTLLLQTYAQAQAANMQFSAMQQKEGMLGNGQATYVEPSEAGVISRNDPILSYQLLHQAVGLPGEQLMNVE